MSISLKFIQRDGFVKQDHQKAVYLRVIVDRKIGYLHLGISTHEKFFKKERVTARDPDYKKKNSVIESSHALSTKIKYEGLDAFQQKLTLPDFLKKYKENQQNNVPLAPSLYEFYETEIVYWQQSLSSESLRTYNSEISKLKTYRPKLSFDEINHQFIKDYEYYMLTKLNNKITTSFKSLSVLKRIINRAIDNEKVQMQNPFAKFQIRHISGAKEFLSRFELNSLQSLFEKQDELSKSELNVLRYFLFCCYTGLRYRDVFNLRSKNIEIVADTDGHSSKIISLIMHKTGEIVRIPIIRSAEKLIPECKFTEQKVFHVLTDQATNRKLKDIMEAAKIKKDIKMHCSRHTFATIGLSLGIPYDVISKLLGHRSVKVTQVYAHYNDTGKIEEMKKWDNLSTIDQV
jgi:site-specific recombinase XerD